MPPESPSIPHAVDHASLRGGRQLLVSGWVFDVDAPAERFVLRVGGVELPPASIRTMRGTRPDVSRHFGVPGSGRWGFTLVAELDAHAAGSLAAGQTMTLAVESRRGRASAVLAPAATASSAALVNATATYTEAERAEQRALLGFVGELSIETLPDVDVVAVDALQGFVRFHVDHAWVADDHRAAYVDGWCIDPDEVIAALHLRLGSRLSGDLRPTLHRYARADLGALFPGRSADDGRDGYAFFVELDEDGANATGAAPAASRGGAATERSAELLIVTRRGEVARVPLVPKPARSALEASKAMLRLLHPHDPSTFPLLTEVAYHGIARVARPHRPTADEVQVHAFGPAAPEAPSCTVLVPLYGRYDFLYHQLARFSHDPAMREVDLVYVVDDPSIHPGVLSMAAAIAPIYGLPFRVVHAGRNLGYAGANNLGARVARAPYLLLLNSDVLPLEPGWLPRLLAHARTLPDAGIVGVRLLYHDGTIQHDGMRCLRDALRDGLFWNHHPGKGLPPELLPRTDVERCELLTGACMLVERALYEQLSGLDDGFVLGDFEDSDFCLRVLAAGRTNYLVRDVVLHHLERQSQALFEDDSWRFKITLFNAVRYARRWAAELPALAARHEGA